MNVLEIQAALDRLQAQIDAGKKPASLPGLDLRLKSLPDNSETQKCKDEWVSPALEPVLTSDKARHQAEVLANVAATKKKTLGQICFEEYESWREPANRLSWAGLAPGSKEHWENAAEKTVQTVAEHLKAGSVIETVQKSPAELKIEDALADVALLDCEDAAMARQRLREALFWVRHSLEPKPVSVNLSGDEAT